MYQTEQRRHLLEFLQENASAQFTIEEIADSPQIASSIGKSTVYRLVRRLLQEGFVTKYPCGDGRKFLYQYVDPGRCQKHLHLKCTACGALIHLENELSSRMMSDIQGEKDFEIDTKQTVIYGRCVACQKSAKRASK